MKSTLRRIDALELASGMNADPIQILRDSELLILIDILGAYTEEHRLGHLAELDAEEAAERQYAERADVKAAVARNVEEGWARPRPALRLDTRWPYVIRRMEWYEMQYDGLGPANPDNAIAALDAHVQRYATALGPTE